MFYLIFMLSYYVDNFLKIWRFYLTLGAGSFAISPRHGSGGYKWKNKKYLKTFSRQLFTTLLDYVSQTRNVFERFETEQKKKVFQR